MDAEIVQLINQLGVSSEGEYKLHPFYKASLYQIKRHLAADKDKVVLLKCSEVNIIGNDIIPIMKIFHNDSEKKDLFLMCLKLCTTLMSPSSTIFEHLDHSNSETITLISKREGYLFNILKSIAYSDLMVYLNDSLLSIINEEEESDISIAVKESIFQLIQLIMSTNIKCITVDEKSIVEEALISKMVLSNIIETMYKYSKKSGYKTDMYMFIHIFGQISKSINPGTVVSTEVVRRKNEERMKRLPTTINVKELVKSIEEDFSYKRTKPLPDDKDPLFPLTEEVNRKKHSQRRRIVMNGRFPGTFVDMKNFTKSGRAKIVNKIETNAMDSIVKQNTFKSFNRSSVKPMTNEDERILTLNNNVYIKLYNQIRMLMLSGFDFKRYAYSDIITWSDVRGELMGAEANYLHLLWFMLKIARLDNIPWLYQHDFTSFENFEIWTERIIDSMNKYEKPKVNYIREKCKYMLNILKEILYRIPSLKNRNEGEYRALIYELYFHSFLKSFVKIYQYLDSLLSSQSLYNSLFSLTSIYFQMAKFVNINGGYRGQLERNDALEVKEELIEVQDLMGQFYNKYVARCCMNFILNYSEKISPNELHNVITVIYYSSFELKKVIFYFEVKFFVCLRKWIYTLKKGYKNAQMLPVLENFLKRMMIHIEEYHLFGVNDSMFLNQISKPLKAKKKKAKNTENEEEFGENENEGEFNDGEDQENEENFIDFEENEIKDDNIKKQENDSCEKINKKISRVVIDDTSDVEEVDDVMEKLNSQNNENTNEGSKNYFLSSDDDESDGEKENDSDDEYQDQPTKLKPEDIFHIYKKKRSLFDDSDDENNEETEESSQRPSKKRKTVEDDGDDDE
uniref:ATP synthase mitochondrial F1 complex assembly factor 2 n=1 Tax=Strongyloides stercoralis TaxID=6248 RepID=A0A0K0EFW9_STRER